MIGRFFEDFAVGQTFRSGRLRIDKERIKTFGAEFDPQSFHLDEEAARDTMFGGLAANCADKTPPVGAGTQVLTPPASSSPPYPSALARA